MTRYFSASPEAYQYVAEQLDAAYGYPNASTRTERALPLLEDSPQANGLVYLAIDATYCDYNLPAEMLPQLLASGQVNEISEAEYAAVAMGAV